MEILDFAEAHGLSIEEWRDQADAMVCVRFDLCELKEGIGLSGIYGRGVTKDDALTDYAKIISGRLLVYHAFVPDRREIKVPELKHSPLGMTLDEAAGRAASDDARALRQENTELKARIAELEAELGHSILDATGRLVESRSGLMSTVGIYSHALKEARDLIDAALKAAEVK